jgi:hypothetical protein
MEEVAVLARLKVLAEVDYNSVLIVGQYLKDFGPAVEASITHLIKYLYYYCIGYLLNYLLFKLFNYYYYYYHYQHNNYQYH